ncbi:MAG: DUF192 domain-containing protein [Hoeflea sp.]|uniref:DUF192 domain-containing protein n=1 Tax=Hoeflea sp. TaxID=1940281 RepID=UPI001D2F82FF|nr:DUF192 domain-containing protein [Hoeflea sp.]MBU4530677.1 DUF192 domain-containing protein [Alphaproteobacteria bacterium]MBU4544897.1 DUF192 domain-containing protein [Alphaproteobacteria bacterium]MBU4552040.1 DUF192 domain-containing protein [Alphaproteobacteria bacterium]MBV1722229.1 DUF192 domain-containing protein [Hoeflea sp.]MBV1761791.1 DUF192 domain-containing protein [Hoeflea sp.]
MRRFPALLPLIISAFLALTAAFSHQASALADVLPTDSEPLVITTGNGPVSFSVELALTPETRASGLMHRQSMDSDHGMLFRFDQTRQVLMWMKNTPLPLDMLFIDDAGTIVGIAEDTTPFSENVIASPGPVRYVLELNAGTAGRKSISVGDRARHHAIRQ